MYVTHKEMVEEVRALRSEIRVAAKDLGGDIKYLHDQLKIREDFLEELNQRLYQIEEKLRLNAT